MMGRRRIRSPPARVDMWWLGYNGPMVLSVVRSNQGPFMLGRQLARLDTNEWPGYHASDRARWGAGGALYPKTALCGADGTSRPVFVQC